MRPVRCACATAVLLVGLAAASGADTITMSRGQSIPAALRRLNGGDTLLLAAGTYQGPIDACTIPSGSPGQPTIQGKRI
jgi:hypothetical protein